MGLRTADATGMAMVDDEQRFEVAFYSIVATGDRGGKASDALVPDGKPLAQ